MNEDIDIDERLLTLTADIVAAHVSNNSVAVSDLPNLISNVHGTLAKLDGGRGPEQAAPVPAISVRSSVKQEHIVCLDCGSKQKMMKRHLMTAHNITPEEYRAKWNLPATYPMVAPSYSEQRRELAVSLGLGTQRNRSGRGRRNNGKS